jgi:uncharacterized protein (DUF2267 family)
VNYDEMVRAVAGQAGLTHETADESIVATLTVLAERVTADETRDLLAQLPKTLKTRIPIAPQPMSFTPDEFVARVAKLTPDDDVANSGARVRAVFSVLGDAVNAGELRDITEQLGDDYAELSGRPQPAASSARRAESAGAGALATATRGAGAALGAARALGGVASGLAGDALQRVRATVGRVPAAATHTLRHAGATGARKAETVADAVEDAADAIEHSAERAAVRFEDRAPTE